MHNPKHRLGLCAAVVAPALLGLLAAGTASASVRTTPSTTGTTITTINAAGYEASGRDFRYIQALIRVPDWTPTGLEPHEYIQLSNGSLGSGDQSVRVGVTYQAGVWETFIASQDNSLFPIHYYLPRNGLHPGDGVLFSIYFDQAGNELHFSITPPTDSGLPDTFKTQAYGPIFDHAAAVDDWTYTTGQPAPLPPFLNPFTINSFLQGARTTYSGAKGSFVGPWTTSQVEATSAGLPYPANTIRVQPGPLGSDGLKANGAARAGDMFAVNAVG